MKRINIDALHPGDIVLTASKSAAGTLRVADMVMTALRTRSFGLEELQSPIGGIVYQCAWGICRRYQDADRLAAYTIGSN